MKRLYCHTCGQPLKNPEVALNLKLRGQGIGFFYCEGCLSVRTDCTSADLRELVRYFTENGCELFARRYVDEE